MNDRVVKLAYQAKLFDGTGTVPFEDVAKFAELIMRDMYEVMKAESEGFDLVNNFGAVQGIDVCMRKVKQHFGVEE